MSEGADCQASYDEREGRTKGGVASLGLEAGSTGAISVISMTLRKAFILNCGDSRTVVVSRLYTPGRRGREVTWTTTFASKDHSPTCPQERRRLALGPTEEDQDVDLDSTYATPICMMGTWRVPINTRYTYGVSRSLEGLLATSQGIVSTPDTHLIPLSPVGSPNEPSDIVCVASDGIWSVLSNEDVARLLGKLREQGMAAEQAARKVCNVAITAGANDNVTCCVVYT